MQVESQYELSSNYAESKLCARGTSNLCTSV
jgi:hypothetical protein